MTEFVEFKKMARLSREIVITEKLDGTNAQICITEDDEFLVGSRTRWITPSDDNYGFAAWAYSNEEELRKLGAGSHFGEWWGQGIQRRYDKEEKTFSLFNVARWSDPKIRPTCCSIVPTLFNGIFCTNAIQYEIDRLKEFGSVAAPGFMQPEGVIIFHTAANISFKKTIEKDESPKGKL